MAQILVAFVLLFYVPTLLFRFTASRRVDLGSRRIIPNQIEDFFAAALPSVLLNGIAWFILNTITLWKVLEVSATLPLLFTAAGAELIQNNLTLINSYYATLLTVAGASGYVYGYVENRFAYYGVAVARTFSGEWWRLALGYHDLWAIFFDSEKLMLFPFVVRPTFVFVRTDRLYHGLLHKYDATNDGQIAGITLAQVHRFNTKSRDECLRTDANLVTPLTGTLWLRWSSIIDINVADVGKPNTLARVLDEYASDRTAARTARTWRGRLRRLIGN